MKSAIKPLKGLPKLNSPVTFDDSTNGNVDTELRTADRYENFLPATIEGDIPVALLCLISGNAE